MDPQQKHIIRGRRNVLRGTSVSLIHETSGENFLFNAHKHKLGKNVNYFLE